MANKTSKSNEAYFARYKTLKRKCRKAPVTPKWSHTMIKEAMLLKPSNKPDPVETNKRISIFSIGARAHDGRGNLVWA